MNEVSHLIVRIKFVPRLAVMTLDPGPPVFNVTVDMGAVDIGKQVVAGTNASAVVVMTRIVAFITTGNNYLACVRVRPK